MIKLIEKDVYLLNQNNYSQRIFEGEIPLNKGMSYNAYVILDDKTALLDSADSSVLNEFVDNLKTVLNGMFQLAFEKGIIKENTLKQITIGIKFRQINKHPSEKMVLQTGEYEALLEYLDEEFKEKQSIKYIAVKFGLFTGLRIGEIIALKWEDLDLENRIMHVQREEVGDDLAEAVQSLSQRVFFGCGAPRGEDLPVVDSQREEHDAGQYQRQDMYQRQAALQLCAHCDFPP